MIKDDEKQILEDKHFLAHKETVTLKPLISLKRDDPKDDAKFTPECISKSCIMRYFCVIRCLSVF
jgi:hypothetical protein